MLIKNKSSSDCHESEVTDPQLYMSRRQFIRVGGALAVLAAGSSLAYPSTARAGTKLTIASRKSFVGGEELTPYEHVTQYNNFYEFGTDKEDPYRNAKNFKPRPWTVTVEGEVNKPGRYDFDDVIKAHALEERIYRLRCVEAWSMVIPWVGFSLGSFLKRFEPTSKAKFVEFTTLYDPKQMPGQARDVLDWPYLEGLRIDEAMNPLAMLAVGLYGESLPPQNGAPLRLVVPWKYGFKNIKSIVKIRLTEKQPYNTWQATAPAEYGFYANVNPNVDHPRWSQAKERRMGEFLKRKTLPFNGYANEVAGMYAGLDLNKYF